LTEIVREIISKRWRRAKNAVQLCNYVPKLISKIYVQRAEASLRTAALLTSRLAPRLEAVRKRIAERRLAARRKLMGAFRTVRYLQGSWSTICEQRRTERLQKIQSAFRMSWFLHVRLGPVVRGARERASEASTRLEADRRREEERRLAEAERQQQQRESLEAERLRLEEESRQQQEEQKRHEEEAKLRQQDSEKQLEKEREEMKKKDEVDRKALDNERAKIQEERAAWEEEKRHKSIARLASPQKKNGVTVVPTVATTDVEEDPAKQAAEETTGAAEVSAGAPDLDSTVKELERKMAVMHRECQAQMALLQEQSRSLAEQLAEERRSKVEQSDSPCKRKPSLIPMDDQEHALLTTPRSLAEATPGGNARQCSPLSIGGTSSKASCASKRKSIAFDALMLQDAKSTSVRRDSHTTGVTGVAIERRWWAEQRHFLLSDLYGEVEVRPEGRGHHRHSMAPGADSGRNLNAIFDRASDADHPMRQARASEYTSSRMRQPTKFDWNKRKSASGNEALR